MEYVKRGLAAGLAIDDFAPRLSFFFDSHLDFFEEIAKFRAARRIWARKMRDVFGAADPRSWMVRFHTQTAGVSLTAQQPENNIMRVAFQALAAVLGGTQSLHTNSMDETLALPTEKAVRIALRTQQVLAYETGVANTIDPLAGSYFIESLTDLMEREAEEIFEEVDRIGGVVRGIEGGYFQREIALSAQRQQLAIESEAQTIVGVNAFTEGNDDSDIDILKIDDQPERSQRERLAALRAHRDDAAARSALDGLRDAGARGDNVIEPMLNCVRAYCTLYEIRHALEQVHGAYKEPVFF
jgi:methylmalonyl-CoA mutase N-terminal domain/subunit